MLDWISIDEKLPEINESVLTVFKGMNGKSFIGMGFYEGYWTVSDCFIEIEKAPVTHWMKLPPLPTSPTLQNQ